MIKNWTVIHEIVEKIDQLLPEEQLYLISQIAHKVSNEHFVDHEELARQAEEMANDPDMQRILRNEDLPLDYMIGPSERIEQKAAS